MPGSPESIPRPLPPRRVLDAAADWFRWVGVARLALAAGSVVLVVAGAAWLLRAPRPDAASALPRAVGPTSVAHATLPEPAESGTPPATPPPTASSPPGVVVVHVAGAVAQPGVRTVDAGARVGDAVQAAGGPAADADLDGLNLAAPLVDGQRIYVPRLGEVDPASLPATPAVDGPAGASIAPGPVDLNRATLEQLESLPGVGPATAAAIIDDRERNGPFASVDDLDRVSGIGPAKLAALRDLVTV